MLTDVNHSNCILRTHFTVSRCEICLNHAVHHWTRDVGNQQIRKESPKQRRLGSFQNTDRKWRNRWRRVLYSYDGLLSVIVGPYVVIYVMAVMWFHGICSLLCAIINSWIHMLCFFNIHGWVWMKGNQFAASLCFSWCFRGFILIWLFSNWYFSFRWSTSRDTAQAAIYITIITRMYGHIMAPWLRTFVMMQAWFDSVEHKNQNAAMSCQTMLY
jgi:hypothetical protein